MNKSTDKIDTSALHYQISPVVTNEQLNELFLVAWPNAEVADFMPVLRHSLAYVCAFANTPARADWLIGFVNLAWDGSIHAFILDTTVHPTWRRRGIGLELVQQAAAVARQQGIYWLHVDYEPQWAEFYRRCGFFPTQAGLMRLQ